MGHLSSVCSDRADTDNAADQVTGYENVIAPHKCYTKAMKMRSEVIS